MASLHPTRRAVLAGLIAIPALRLPAAAAVSPSQAQSLVQQLVNDIQTVIDSGRSTGAVLQEFERIFERYADVSTIARFSLGPAARGASTAQLREFSDAFSTYVSRKYGRRFQEFKGGKITVNGARQDGNVTVVQTTANLRGEEPFAVDFHLSDRSGSAKMFNVIIEGVNMLTTERAEITALLDREGGDIAALTRRLRNI